MKVVAVAVAALAVVIAPAIAPAADMDKPETINTYGAIMGKAILERPPAGMLMSILVVGFPLGTTSSSYALPALAGRTSRPLRVTSIRDGANTGCAIPKDRTTAFCPTCWRRRTDRPMLSSDPPGLDGERRHAGALRRRRVSGNR